MSVKWLRHAFAVESSEAAVPTEAQKAIVDRVCSEIARRHLTTPALIFLESFRPLNYLGSQALHFFHPVASAILDGEAYRQFADFLERRGSIDYLCRRIEELEAEYSRNEKGKRSGASSAASGESLD